MGYLWLFLLVFGVNLLPAFGPPTWTLLVFVRLNWHLNAVGIVVLGAMAATSGRILLALACRRFRHRLPTKLAENLGTVKQYLGERRSSTWAMFAIFVVSPLPSAQMFEAAGLMELPLMPICTAFFFGRLLSYSFYVGVATVADNSLDGVFSNAFGSPASIALQVGLLIAVSLLPFINWKKLLGPRLKKTVVS